MLFSDTAFLRPRLIEYGFVEPPMFAAPPFGTFASDPSIHFRHGSDASRVANVVWLDGHVAAEAMTFSRGNVYSASLEQHEAAGIGWFGDDDNTLFDLE